MPVRLPGVESTDPILPDVVIDATMPYYDVRTFGAVGTADDSAVFNAAATAAAVGGGIVQFPAGTYNCVNVVIHTNVHYQGCGKGVTTLKLVGGTNGQVFITENWASLTGTDTDDGPTDWSVSDMTIDANGTGNTTASWGMLIYGSRFDLTNLDFYGHRTGAISSEWSTTSGPDRMEAHVLNVNCHTSFDSHGIVWDGPHDSHWTSVSAISTITTSTKYGFLVKAKALGLRLVNCHVWGSHQWAAVIDGAATWFTQCFLEGGQTGQLLVRANLMQYQGGWILGNAVTGVKGIELGVVAGASAEGCDIDTAVIYCRGGALGLVNQVSNKIRLHVSRDTADPVVYGSAVNTDWSDVSIQVEGTAGADEYEQFRRRLILTNRSTANSPVITTFGHASQTGRQQSWRSSADFELAAVGVNGELIGNEPVVADAGATRTLALVDRNAVIFCVNATACAVTVPTFATVPFPVGTRIKFVNGGPAGALTLVAAGGVTLVAPVGQSLSAKASYSEISVVCLAANTWVAGGDLTGA